MCILLTLERSLRVTSLSGLTARDIPVDPKVSLIQRIWYGKTKLAWKDRVWIAPDDRFSEAVSAGDTIAAGA